MPPEIKHYVRPEDVEKLKSMASSIASARLLSIRPREEDLSDYYHNADTLVPKARNILSQLPQDTKIGNLTGGRNQNSSGAYISYYQIDPNWEDFRHTLTRDEKLLLSKTLRLLMRLGHLDHTLAEVSQIDWGEIEKTHFRNLGPKVNQAARQIFEGTITQINQPTLPGF
jgi:hypothetical protein